MHSHWDLCGGFRAWRLATIARCCQRPATHLRYARLDVRLALSTYGVRRRCITRCQRHVSFLCASIRRMSAVDSTSETCFTTRTLFVTCCRAVAWGTRAVAIAMSTASRATFFNVVDSFRWYWRRQERSTTPGGTPERRAMAAQPSGFALSGSKVAARTDNRRH